MVKVSFKSNWGGGSYNIDVTKIKYLYLNGKKKKFLITEIDGEDYDHGHTTSWSRWDVLVKFKKKSNVGTSLSEICDEHNFYAELCD